MTISGLLKSTKTITVHTIKLTVKKYPLSFLEYCNMKALEGTSYKTDEKGNINEIATIGNYNLDLITDKLFYGLSSWELIDSQNHSLELTREACLTLATEYPDFAEEVIKEIQVFNTPLNKKEKKSLS